MRKSHFIKQVNRQLYRSTYPQMSIKCFLRNSVFLTLVRLGAGCSIRIRSIFRRRFLSHALWFLSVADRGVEVLWHEFLSQAEASSILWRLFRIFPKICILIEIFHQIGIAHKWAYHLSRLQHPSLNQPNRAKIAATHTVMELILGQRFSAHFVLKIALRRGERGGSAK